MTFLAVFMLTVSALMTFTTIHHKTVTLIALSTTNLAGWTALLWLSLH